LHLLLARAAASIAENDVGDARDWILRLAARPGPVRGLARRPARGEVAHEARHVVSMSIERVAARATGAVGAAVCAVSFSRRAESRRVVVCTK
tara:strand:+ start:3738 stop:4016 length:279 start_codon:yes stop_codon:yes gene_type:complete